MSFADGMISAARLKMLQLLERAAGYSANNDILHTALGSMGIRLSSAAVRAELAYLEECGTVKLMDVGPMVVAELTERGLDVARGTSTMRGIDRPLPGGGL